VHCSMKFKTAELLITGGWLTTARLVNHGAVG
jgi:hypothetical protein